MVGKRSDSPEKGWSLDEARDFIQSLEVWLGPAGYHVGLLGSVLRDGTSHKDLDLVIFPLSTERLDGEACLRALETFGLTQVHGRSEVQARWRRRGSEDRKHVEVWRYGSKRVDLFFMQ